jgi:hypothetical protein
MVLQIFGFVFWCLLVGFPQKEFIRDWFKKSMAI